MVRRNPHNKNGFTIIELIVIIAIIGIIIAIAIPKVYGFTEQARTNTDIANLRILNSFTILYALSENITNDDKFSDISYGSNYEFDSIPMQNRLILKGYLDRVIKAQHEGYQFIWDRELSPAKWRYTMFQVAPDNLSGYIFKNLELNEAGFIFSKDAGDVVNEGDWAVEEQGFQWSPENSNSRGLLFIPNPSPEYTITTTASLGSEIYSGSSRRGGYGILFETVVSDTNRDTGYVLQFDRGYGNADGTYGAVIIRRRVNGSERAITAKDIISLSDKTASWWMEPHEFTLNVQQDPSDTSKKVLDVVMKDATTNDTVQLFSNWIISNPVAVAENNYTGFRSWYVNSTFESMLLDEIEP